MAVWPRPQSAGSISIGSRTFLFDLVIAVHGFRAACRLIGYRLPEVATRTSAVAIVQNDSNSGIVSAR